MSWNSLDWNHQILNALPSRISGAILEVHHKTGAPIEIVILVAISALSASLHGYVIRTPSGRPMSLQLYCIGMAPPTSGKGAAAHLFYRAIRDFDSSLSDHRKLATDAASHPALRDLLLVDATWPSLLEVLDGESNSAIVFDEDCIDLLKSDFMKRRGKLNRIFDTSPKESMNRRGEASLTAYHPQISFLGLTQNKIYADYLKSSKDTDRNCGLAARILYCCSTQRRGPGIPTLPTPCLDGLLEVSKRLLNKRLHEQLTLFSEPRSELFFDEVALRRWEHIKSEIDQRREGDLSDISDAADRATEKVWRTAASVHCYACIEPTGNSSDPIGELPGITWQAIEAGWILAQGSFAEFRKVFPPAMRKPPKPSAVLLRQEEETRIAMHRLYVHLKQAETDTLPMSEVSAVSFLTNHKFKSVYAHLKVMKFVEETKEKPPACKFTARFFAQAGYQHSVEPGVHTTTYSARSDSPWNASSHSV